MALRESVESFDLNRMKASKLPGVLAVLISFMATLSARAELANDVLES